MAQWRVYNRHVNGLTHTEKFMDEVIVIKAGEFKLMDYEAAVQFRGQYFPMKKLPDGSPDPASYKQIHIEVDPDSAKEDLAANEKFVCHLDGKHFVSQSELTRHVQTNYAAMTFSDPLLDAQIKKGK